MIPTALSALPLVVVYVLVGLVVSQALGGRDPFDTAGLRVVAGWPVVVVVVLLVYAVVLWPLAEEIRNTD